MAVLHAGASGNWTAASTWRLVNAAALLDSQAANAVLTTAFVSSGTFTPGAVTVDGIAVKIATRTASPNGTMSVRLAQGGVAVGGTTVTINVSDIPDDIGTAGVGYAGCSLGWFFFKFGSPVALVAATLYTVQATTSVATQVNLFRDATAGNWSRLLRTTTTQAPAAGDNLFIGGEWTAAATKTDITVTLDDTSATDYGSGSIALASLGVSKGGTLTAATAASTQYTLRLSGIWMLWVEGVVTLGTSGTPIPSGSSLTIQFDCGADGDFGIVSYGAWSDYGSPRTTGKLFVRTRLTADVAVAATSLSVADDTGWLSGDTVVLAPTLVATHGEARVLNGDAGASTVALTAGLTNAHDGDAPNETQADVILLTRNVRYTVVTTTFYSYIHQRAGTWASTWAEFSRIGTVTGAKHGFSIDQSSTGGTFTFCSIAFCKADFAEFTLAGVTFTFVDTVTWLIGESVQGLLVISANQSPQVYATRLTMIGNGTTSCCGFYVGGLTAVLRLDDCRFAGLASIPLRIDSGVAYASDCEWYQTNDANGTILNNSSAIGSRYVRCRFWRVGGGGLQGSGIAEWIDCEFYGMTGRMDLAGRQRLVNCSFNSVSGFNMVNAHQLSPNNVVEWNGCTFGVVSGDRTALTGTAIDTQSQLVYLTIVNCVFNGTAIQGVPAAGSIVAQQDEDGVVADHVTRQYGFGTATIDTTVVGDAAPSLKLTPEHLYRQFRSPLFTRQINSGQIATFTAKVRKTGAYNGEPPTLVLAANASIGITTDTVLATLSVAADTWDTLTGAMSAPATQDGVAGVWVACDGSAGDVYVDDITVVTA